LSTPTIIRLSPNSLGHYNVCRRFHWYYKIRDRRLVRTSPGRANGTAMHAGMLALNQGKSVAEQEAAIDAAFAASPTPVDDYRQASFAKDGLAAFRAEFGSTFADWTIEETEAQGEVELGRIHWGVYSPRNPASDFLFVKRSVAEPEHEAVVMFEFRRDLVAVSPEGQRFVFDYKTASRNEQVEYEAAKVSGALKAYARTYQMQHGKPVHGAYLIRLIMRKPSRTGVAFEFPKDGPIYFSDAVLDEWQRQTLRIAREILERDPNDPDDWPLSSTDKGACRFQWGACDYLGVCQLPPADRLLKLSTDEFEDAEAAKQRERAGDGATQET